jgi:hypothetical protein
MQPSKSTSLTSAAFEQYVKKHIAISRRNPHPRLASNLAVV